MLTEQIQAAIAKVQSTIATMEVTTQVKPGITKRAKINVVLGTNVNFGRIVNARRQKGGLEAVSIQPRQWGQRIPNTPYVWHNGKLYLECLVLKTLSEKYFNRDGVEIPKDEVFNGGQAPNVYDLGKDSPKWRTYKLDSIQQVTSKKIRV
jgi:hypothetical protein